MPRSNRPPTSERSFPAPADAVRVFVSYSHDSPAHMQRVLQLANELRDGGIDCELDQYEEAPPEGWPAWMADQVRQARYVLVVCTATYHRRVIGAEVPGVGLGARWEGGFITQELYEAGGRNDKFIPVVFDPSNLKDIPDFLRHTTRYDVSDETQRERLYRRLTSQPRVIRRPLGTVRRLPSDGDTSPNASRAPQPRQTTRPRAGTRQRSRDDSAGSDQPSRSSARDPARRQVADRSNVSSRRTPLALIQSAGPSKSHFIHLRSAEVRGEETTAVLHPTSGEERAFLETLASQRFGLPTVDFAFGTTAMRSRLRSVVRTFDGGEDQFALVLGPHVEQGYSMEMATSDVSADDIARLRARRILLDEPLPIALGRLRGSMARDSMLEVFVRGLQTALPVDHSPLPPLFQRLGAAHKRFFLEAAKLTAVLWLRLSGTIEHVLELKLKLTGSSDLTVHFRGIRARIYTNKDPEIIEVDGVCHLSL